MLGKLDSSKSFFQHSIKLLFFFIYSVMLFIIGLPCLQIILFCWAIGHDPTGLKLAIANYEQNSTDISSCPITMGCNYTMLSCRYLDLMRKKKFVLVSYFNDIIRDLHR